MNRPLIISAPHPRSIDLIFSDDSKEKLFANYELHEVDPEDVDLMDKSILAQARYILGQPPLALETVQTMTKLRCVFNVESNLINNMPYTHLFERGIHVVTTGAVFSEPVAEMGLAMALTLARDVVEADVAFREGRELWGGDGNQNATLLSNSRVGIIGFGDLGRAIAKLLQGFRAEISAFDPWLPPSLLREAGVIPTDLDTILRTSQTIFVVASVTSENKGFLNAAAFARMPRGTRFILLSRADVVEFDDLMEAVRSGHILAASDVFPEEPLAPDHPVRGLRGFLRSAHRAGALDIAFKRMGDMVLEDMALLDKGLPPMRCKRAERETVSRMRSRPVEKS
ncbi:hydroxyacid dehydrogenase [Yoonia vestfoldensis]|uniref:Hydroxypyruvate reductase n=1 Tax=Yoonia vestfoldensis TaxID=245188 RepID=A0A1Y0EEL3_9RHOB|nr:hydroxyacid dehydrogenase [Yoonia vestfoldensis]ARU01801.1 hydroxypyruvate reductase [Yoonia vestfoldensis]